MTRSALLSLLAASLFLTGCETVNEWLEPSPEAPPVLEQNLSQPYLDMLSQLVTGDAGKQEAIFERTHGDWLADPSAAKLLAYALVLATPGHAHSDAQAAQTHFSQLLANPEALDQFRALDSLASSLDRATLEAAQQKLAAYKLANGITTPALAVLPFGVDQRQAIRDLSPA